jgi:hypothetical protein
MLVALAATYTKHNKHKRLTSIPSAGYEHAMKANECPQIYGLTHMGNRIGILMYINIDICQYCTQIQVEQYIVLMEKNN